MIKIYIKEDESSHQYIVPESVVEDFNDLIEKIDDAENYSEEWYSLTDQFNTIFGKYREYAYNTELWITEEELERITR